MQVGTWITSGGLSNPQRTAAELRAAGLTFASIMLNDLSAKRSEAEFVTHPEARIIALARALNDEGLDVSLTTWVMPHRGFIRSMAASLIPLLEATASTGLILDAEEPWIRARGGMHHDDAADQIGELFAGEPLVLSGIASTHRSALRGLAKICRTWSPQCYATTRSGSMLAETAVARGMDLWRKKFGEPEAWMAGLAAYSQPTPASTYMRPCLDQAIERMVGSVCYWSHRPILRNADIRSVISGINTSDSITIPAHGPRGSIMPELDVEAAPSGVIDHAIAQLQGLLAAAMLRHGDVVDPGKLDGKPGPRTLAALHAFQAAEELPVTGVVDGQTWWVLLSS